MDDSRLCGAVDPRRCLQSHEGPAVKLKIEKGSSNSWIQVNRFGPLVGLVGRRGGRVIIDNYNRPQSPCSTKVPKHCGAPLSTFLSMAGEPLGYVEGYRFLQNPKVLIMNILRISISALWRRYSWFESMRGRFREARNLMGKASVRRDQIASILRPGIVIVPLLSSGPTPCAVENHQDRKWALIVANP